MAVLHFISATSTATLISQDSHPTPPGPRLAKVVLPKKKPLKWSTGVAPGDYGGPPASTKLRKYWGGEEEDPLTSHGFIWNKDYMGHMKRFLRDPQAAHPTPAHQSPPAKDSSAGFLSLTRVMNLDNLDVDLSKELTAPSRDAIKPKVEPNHDIPGSGNVSRRWKLAPTQREQEKWDRASKAATGGSDVMFRELRQSQNDPALLAAESREQYFKLKKKLQILTLGIGGIGLISSYVSYSPEIAASYGAGLVGSLAYIRMLGGSVDSLAAGARGLVKGAAMQPRLLVPVVLVMVFNRWNAILVPEYGLMQLKLIPMLVGFFTYKIATFAQAFEDALNLPTNKASP